MSFNLAQSIRELLQGHLRSADIYKTSEMSGDAKTIIRLTTK